MNKAISNDRAPLIQAETWEHEDGGEIRAIRYGIEAFNEFVR